MVTTTARTKTAKRGIEPIVAAILLIAIAIVAGVILYLWVSRLITSGATSTTTAIAAQMQVISTTYQKGSDNNYHIYVYVRSPVTLSSSSVKTVLIYTVSGTIQKTIDKECGGATKTDCYTVSNVNGDVYEIDITLDSSGLSSGIYYCEIVTSYGTLVTPTFTVS